MNFNPNNILYYLSSVFRLFIHVFYYALNKEYLCLSYKKANFCLLRYVNKTFAYLLLTRDISEKLSNNNKKFSDNLILNKNILYILWLWKYFCFPQVGES